MGTKPSTYNNPRAIHYCYAPSGRLVGWIEKDNAHYWGSGRTFSDLEKHVKNSLYIAKRCSVIGYFLDSAPVSQEDVPVQVMSHNFRTKAWYGGKEKAKVTEAIEVAKKSGMITRMQEHVVTKPAPVDDVKYDYFDTAMDGTMLVVYGVVRKEVARYNTNPMNRIPTPLMVNENDDE